MRKLLPSVCLMLFASLLTGIAQPSFQFNQRLTNEIRNARARLNAQPSKLTPAELNRLAETLARSNLLATVIGESIARNDLTNAAALLKEFPGKLGDIRLYGQPLLYRAVIEGKEELLDFLLENKADPEAVAPYGEPALAQAMQYRRWSMAAKLIQAGASVTRTNNQGRTPAGMFFEQWYPGSAPADGGLTNLLSLMLEYGLDPFAAGRPSWQGSTLALQQTSLLEDCLNRESNYGGGWGWAGSRASSFPTMTFFGDLLLTNKPSPARRTPLGDTALHLAALWQRTNAIEFLLATGFNIDQTNNAGLTPLQSLVGSGAGGMSGYFGQGFNTFPIYSPAMMRSRVSGQPVPQFTMVDYLLSKGATLDIYSAAGLGRTNDLAAMLATNTALANIRDGYGRTPLHYAALVARPENTAPFIRVGPRGMPMVVTASPPTNSLPNVVSMLLKADANPSAATSKSVRQFRNSPAVPAGTTPLHLAARNGNTSLIRTLLAAHADAKLTDENGDSPLHLAARNWATNSLPLLLAARAPLEATNHAGQTPLRAAVEASCGPSVEALLKMGASPTNGLGSNTLLHIAAEHGDVATATILLKHGLALDARDAEGRTSFQKAVTAKQWNSVVFLRDEGANLNAADSAGNTALHLLARDQDDSVYHATEEPAFVQWERKQLATPGWIGRALSMLIQSKVLTPPPPQGWTNTSLAAWLVEHGAKVNVTNRAGQAPLHVLCGAEWARWYETAQASNRVMTMLNAGANLDLRDTNGLTPLQLSAAGESGQMFTFLLTRAGPRLNQPDAQGRTLLHRAVENARDNFERVSALIAAGADPNAADQQGRTPLHLAMRFRNDGYDYRSRDLAFMLLTNKASPNLADNDGRTPLHFAFESASASYDSYAREVIPLLLTNGVNPNAADKSGRTPLHVLMGSTNSYVHPFDQMRDVLRDPRWDFAARDTNGQTPIHLWAARNDPYGNDWDAFKRIVTNQDLLNLTNFAGDTPLHLAIRANKDQVARVLMQAGANPLLKNRRGESALRLAVEKAPAYYDQEVHPPGTRYRFFDSIRMRDEKDVNLWLEADPSLASLTNQDGVTPLMAASDSGNAKIVARLLELGAPLDALSALRLGRMDDFLKLLSEVHRPVPGDWLFEAVRFGQLAALQALIAAGGDVQFTDADDNSLLFAAAFYKRPDLANWLKTKGCRETLSDAVIEGSREKASAFINADANCVNATNRSGRTPLYRAAAAGQTEVVALLIERGAKVDAVMPGGWTALHAAAARDAAGIGRLLLQAGASPNAVATGNMAPLHLAAALGGTNMAEVLLQNGADINLVPPQQGGAFRNAPLHWAAHLGKVDMFIFLLAHGADLKVVNGQNETPLEMARATARGRHWNFTRPPETPYKHDQTMFQPAKRDAIIKQLEEAAAIGKP